MSDIHTQYFQWLVKRVDGSSRAYERLCRMLHQVPFRRRVGNDVNRAEDGVNLRYLFVDDQPYLDQDAINELLTQDCTWFEMLVALAEDLDYLYEGGVKDRFIELITNMGLLPIVFNGQPSDLDDEADQILVDAATQRIDENRFDYDGRGGLFPLMKRGHPDQRSVEIWDQHAAYFRERLEGVMWTSTN